MNQNEELAKEVRNELIKKGFMNDDSLLQDFIIITHQVTFDPNGDDVNRYGYLLSNDGLPWHTILGLLRVTEKSLNLSYSSGYEEDDD